MPNGVDFSFFFLSLFSLQLHQQHPEVTKLLAGICQLVACQPVLKCRSSRPVATSAAGAFAGVATVNNCLSVVWTIVCNVAWCGDGCRVQLLLGFMRDVTSRQRLCPEQWHHCLHAVCLACCWCGLWHLALHLWCAWQGMLAKLCLLAVSSMKPLSRSK